MSGEVEREAALAVSEGGVGVVVVEEEGDHCVTFEKTRVV